MKNLHLTIFYLIIVFALPLIAHVDLLFHYKTLVLMLVSCIMLLWANPVLSNREGKTNARSDKGTLMLIFICGYISIAAPVVEWAYFKTDTGWTAWTTIGFILTFGGLAFRIWSLRVLGRFFTGTVQQVEGHQLVTSRPYQWLRHPSYTGSMIAFLGCAVFLEAWVGLAIAFLSMSIAYFFRIRAEEMTLTAIFGTAYQRYREQTWGLMPFVW
jgi:protein-S-isoprenylcysteine O-methyltransferase